MKKRSIMAVLMIVCTGHLRSQAILTTSIGWENKSFPVVSMEGGFQYKNILIQSGVISNPLVQSGATTFPVEVGYQLWLNNKWSLTPMAGAGYHLYSLDKNDRSQNLWKYIAGIRAQRKDAYLEIRTSNGSVCVSVGLKAILKSGY